MSGRPGALLLLRHGESTANANGLFTGVLDVPLTERGICEARAAAALIRDAGLTVDIIYTSPLRRARATADVIAGLQDISDVQLDWRLNERNYGALTGQSKSDVQYRYGREQFLAWRRSVDAAPPPMPETLHQRLASHEPFDQLPAEALPYTESLRTVIARVRAFADEILRPMLASGRTVLIVAHGNSLRALCACLDGLSDGEISALNIPTGQPLLYQFTPALELSARGGRYLDEERALAAAAEVAEQGGT